MKWFTKTATVAEIKKQYRELAKQYHPDMGGDEATMKEITGELETALAMVIRGGVDEFAQEKGYTPNVDEQVFGEILAQIIDWNITIEVIGFWVYAFDSYAYREQLKSLGFWFSKKHKAWVYSGTKKRKRRTNLTTDDVRAYHGSQRIREREDEKELAEK